MRVSSIIHQTWKNRLDVPDLQQSWAWSHDEQFEYSFVDDKEMSMYMENHCTDKEISCFKRLTNGAAKADLYRYSALYRQGGVYVDIDVFPIIKLTDFIKTSGITVVNDNYGLYNAFFCCEKGHPLIRQCINLVCDNIIHNKHNGGNHAAIFSLSGPSMFATVFRDFFKIPPGTKLKECDTEDYRVLHHDFERQRIKYKTMDVLQTQMIHECQYESYRNGEHYREGQQLYK